MLFHLRPRILLFLITLLALTSLIPAPARDWPQWRGPFLNGSTDETGLPASWDPASAKWATPLPGEAGSTPVVCGDRIYLTSTDRADKTKLYAMGLNRADGRILWTKTFPGEGRKMPYSKDASPSPVADGKRAIFLFGNGTFLATDPDGRTLWERSLEREIGPLAQTFIHGSSPLLYHDRLYLAVLRNEYTTASQFYKNNPRFDLQSLLLCVDPATGKDLWRQARPTDDFTVESRDSYATPIPWESAPGQAAIVTVGGNFLVGQDWQTGQVLWSMRYGLPGGYRRRVVPTPVVAGPLLVANRPRSETVYAVRPAPPGEWAWDKNVAWQYEGKSKNTDTPSLLFYRDRLYMLHDKKHTLTCLDPATGREIWVGDLGFKSVAFASPTGADGKIYCMDLGGEVVAAAAGDQFKILGRMKMGGNPTVSTIVPAGGELFIRTEETLYCIGKKQ